MFGIKTDDIQTIQNIIARYPSVEGAVIFGSRALGNYNHGSDVDIALKGGCIDYSTILNISTELNEETIMPYHFDVLSYSSLENQRLKEHIDRVGLELYTAKPVEPETDDIADCPVFEICLILFAIFGSMCKTYTY